MLVAVPAAMFTLKSPGVFMVEHSAERGWRGLFPHNRLMVADEEMQDGVVATLLNDTPLTDLSTFYGMTMRPSLVSLKLSTT